ncbi:MAG: response regulator [Deltaproteobacteria bacterium]|jgi:DNA-binding NtrC family response regulator|nr:response regulator [Deltaproteobacteria bacterium]
MAKLSILVLDDEAIVGKRIRPALGKLGHEVDVVASGSEAIQRIEGRVYDIVVSDIRMEGVDGMEVLRRARARSARTLVIMITGFATVDAAREALTLGAFDFIAKPFKLDDLRATIARAARKLAETDAARG